MCVCVCVYVCVYECVYECESHFVYGKKIIGMKKNEAARQLFCHAQINTADSSPLRCRWCFTSVAEVIRMFTYENFIRNLTHDLTLKQTLKTITGSR